MWFPAADDEADLEPHRGRRRTSTGATRSILLVEDEEELRRLAVQELDRPRLRRRGGLRLGEALEVARSLDGRIDLLVTDVVMPGMSGVELAALGAPSGGRCCPCSSSPGTSTRDRWGATRIAEDADLLAKPFTPDQLGHRVRQALDRAQARGPEGVGCGQGLAGRRNRAAWS